MSLRDVGLRVWRQDRRPRHEAVLPSTAEAVPGAAARPAASEAAWQWGAWLPSPRGQWLLLVSVLLLVDALATWTGLTLAYALRLSSGLLDYHATWDAGVYRALALVAVPMWVLWSAVVGLYRRDNLLGGMSEYRKVLDACTGGVMQLILVSFLWRDLALMSRGWLVLSWGLSVLLMLAGRFTVRRLAYRMRRSGWFRQRVLMVGANEQGVAIAEQWHRSRSSGMDVVGFLDDFKPVGTPVLNGTSVIGRPTALDEVAAQTRASEVVVVAGAIAWETFEEIVARAATPRGYVLRVSPGFYETLATGVAVTNKTFVPLFSIDRSRLVGLEAVAKTLLDYGIALPLLIPAAPLTLLLALLIRRLRPGQDLLARYRTVGQGGRPFTMYKLPSRPDAAASSLERRLYRTGLDKLPQLWNVVRGDMSLVGPRPRVLGEPSRACQDTARNLQTVKPGITGPWRVSGHWSSGDEYRDELYYVRNWTFWFDIQILLRSLLSGSRLGPPPAPGPCPGEELSDA